MKKLHFIIATLSTLFLLGDSLACDDRGSLADDNSLTIVVGNCRRAGGVKESSALLVEQKDADFTHTQSFKGRVISVDICSLQSHLKYPHLTIDFANASPEMILSGLDNFRPNCAFFEWFPSCLTQSPDQNITPLLFPALKNAFAILPPGGKLIIDHNPYTLNLPDTSQEAFAALREKVKINSTHLSKAISSFERIKEPGIISHFLQIADPFTLHMCRQERVEILNYLKFRYNNSDDALYDDAKCQFIKGKDKDINLLLTRFSSALDMDKGDLIALINNGMVASSHNRNEELHGYWDLFEQQYYMTTRGPLILQALRTIGFSVEENAIQYHEVNPYNKRKHAWLISAKKPMMFNG